MHHGLFAIRGFAFVLLFSASFSIFAVDEPFSEQAYLQEFPVVLTASRLKQPLSEAPNAMTVIDQSMIKASGFRNIADLFSLVPGMYVGHLNGYSPIVSYHGTTDNYARRMQVLVDGLSVYLPPYGGVNWEDIPILIEDIERIEIIRGPAAASYGANSTQGVISIITHDASAANGNKASVRQGSGGIFDTAARFGRTGADVDYRFSMGTRSDSGYNSLYDDNLTQLANWRSNYHPNGSDNVEVQLGYSKADRGDGVQKSNGTSPYRRLKSSFESQQISWSRALPAGDEIKVQYHHTHSTFDDTSIEFVTGTTTPFPQLSISTQRHDVELQHIKSLGETNRLVWGLGARYDAVTAPLGFDTLTPTLHQTRVFAHDEWRATTSAVVNAGAMWEDDGMGHRNISPRLALNYHVTPQHTLRIGSSIAYRSPAAVEEFGNTQATAFGQIHSLGGVRPERMLSKEIGYLAEFPVLGLSADTRIYSDQLSDLIYLDGVPYVTPYGNTILAASGKNLYDVNFRGIESTIKYHWRERADLTVNLSHQQASCSGASLPTYYSNPYYGPSIAPVFQATLDQCPSMVPTNSGSILYSHHLASGLQLSAGYYYQDAMQVLDAFYIQTTMRRTDIRIAKPFGSLEKSGGGEVALVLQNVFQDNYTEYSNVQEISNLIFNRRAYITATLHF